LAFCAIVTLTHLLANIHQQAALKVKYGPSGEISTFKSFGLSHNIFLVFCHDFTRYLVGLLINYLSTARERVHMELSSVFAGILKLKSNTKLFSTWV